jgi:PAS domain S-box-containing protein
LIALVVFVALLAGGAGGFALVNDSQNSIRDEALSTNLSQAQLVASFASEYISSLEQNIESFAARTDIQQAIFNDTPEQLQSILASFVAVQSALESAAIFDASGIQRVNSVKAASTVGQSFTDRVWYQAVMSTHKPVLSAPVKSRLTGSPSVPYSVPVLDEKGQVRGLVNGVITLQDLSSAILNIDYGSDTRISLLYLNDGGIILAHQDASRIMTAPSGKNEAVKLVMAGQTGVIETTSSTGESDLIGFAQVSHLPWGSLVITPSATALSLIGTLQKNMGIMTGIIILVAGVFGALMAIGISRPLRQLSVAAGEIGHGNLDYPVPTGGHDEIGDLSRATARMSKDLKQSLVSREILLQENRERRLAELRLREVSAHQQAVLAAVPDIIMQVDLSNVYIWANQEGLNFFGADVIGKNPADYFVGQQDTEQQFAILLAGTTETVYIESWQRRKDGESRLLAWWCRTLFNDQGEVVGALSAAQDITEHKQMQISLVKSAKQWEETFNSIKDAISIIGADHRILRANTAMATLVGLPIKEVIGKHCYEIIHGLGSPLDGCPHLITMTNGQSVVVEVMEPRLDAFVEVSTSPILGADGKPFASVHIIRDITERKKIETKLSDSESRLRTLFTSMAEGVALHKLILDEGGKPCNYQIIDVNSQFESIIGIKRSDIVQKLATDAYGLADAPFLEVYAKVALLGNPCRFESHFVPMDKYFEISVTPWGNMGFATVFSDVTEKKLASKRISASLAEKEVLLKEIQHRVKNNMQVVASLLKLQSGRVKDPRDAQLFQDSQESIKSMALVYERLYQSEDLAHISLRKYVTDLVGGLIKSYCTNPAGCKTVIDVSDIEVNLDVAIPCGLVMNEVISNSLKYAFPKNAGGTIKVIVHHSSSDLVLELSDDGIGLPDGFSPEKQTGSLGVQLIHTLVRHQLGGKVDIDSSSGTKYVISIPKEKLDIQDVN